MHPSWFQSLPLSQAVNSSSEYKNQSGIYVLSSNKLIPRAMGEDKAGILYIGKSKNLYSRISGLRTSNHNATWYLYNNRKLAKFYISKDIPSNKNEGMSKYVESLIITLVKDSPESGDLEAISLLSYVQLYGESPPLNNALPKKWDYEATEQDVNWFKSKWKIT